MMMFGKIRGFMFEETSLLLLEVMLLNMISTLTPAALAAEVDA